MRMARAKESLMKSRNLPADCTREEFEQTCDFLKKVKEMDQERSHHGIFLEYINVMKLYQSGSLSVVDVKNRVAIIFRNCHVLLDSFHRLLKNPYSNSHSRPRAGVDVVRTDPRNLRRLKDFLKMLSRDCEELRGVFIETFARYVHEHQDVRILKEKVDLILRDYPWLRDEFRLILVDHGLLLPRDDHVITREEEDELFESDLYLEGLKAAIEFAGRQEEEGREKPPVSVYGAIRRFCKQRRKPYSMRNPRRAIRTMLPALERKCNELQVKKDNLHRRCI